MPQLQQQSTDSGGAAAPAMGSLVQTNAAGTSDGVAGKSDLQVVAAANLPAPQDSQNGPYQNDVGMAPSDEDSVPVRREDQLGEFADNDDLEQIQAQRIAKRQ